MTSTQDTQTPLAPLPREMLPTAWAGLLGGLLFLAGAGLVQAHGAVGALTAVLGAALYASAFRAARRRLGPALTPLLQYQLLAGASVVFGLIALLALLAVAFSIMAPGATTADDGDAPGLLLRIGTLLAAAVFAAPFALGAWWCLRRATALTRPSDTPALSGEFELGNPWFVPNDLSATLRGAMKTTNLQDIIEDRFAAAVASVVGEPVDPVVRPSQDPRFGDYQCNAAMSLAKRLQSKPRDVAQRIIDALDIADLAEPPEIAGPGFINVRVKSAYLAEFLGRIPRPGDADRLGQDVTARPTRVVIDYSSPNIAKEMHVGHLRSTIIGDVFARVLAFEGHDVVPQNHVGDWGTQMGRVIHGLWRLWAESKRSDNPTAALEALTRELTELKAGPAGALAARLKEIAAQHQADLDSDPDSKQFAAFIRELETGAGPVQPTLETFTAAYRCVNALESAAAGLNILIADPADRAQTTSIDKISNRVTTYIQRGDACDEVELAAWRLAVDASLNACQQTYDRLGVRLTRDDVRGESFYDPRLPDTVADLKQALPPRAADAPPVAAEVVENQGAQCVFLYDAQGAPAFKGPDGDPLPMIVQKSDGAFLYATTDLAALRFRLSELGADRIVYVTDARQKLHFEMLFATARVAGWAPADVALDHVTFGSVLGEDRRPLKTRSGENIKLSDLLDEAEARVLKVLETREAEEGSAPQFTEDEKRGVARRVGVGAIKYADLVRDRTSDYVFNWDTMLAFQGNTAPYMMYAYARIRSIYRKAAERFGEPDVYADGVALTLDSDQERTLALRLTRLRETLDTIANDLTPHVLCAYLFDLAQEFSRFYEACPVLDAPDEAARLSRMRLCDLTARTLKLGLGLLGIETIEKM